MTTVRLALTSTLGAVDPFVGLAAGAFDAYFVGNWLRGYRPKLYLDGVAQLALSSSKYNPRNREKLKRACEGVGDVVRRVAGSRKAK